MLKGYGREPVGNDGARCPNKEAVVITQDEYGKGELKKEKISKGDEGACCGTNKRAKQYLVINISQGRCVVANRKRLG